MELRHEGRRAGLSFRWEALLHLSKFVGLNLVSFVALKVRTPLVNWFGRL